MKKFIWTVLALMSIAFGALFGVYKHWKETGKLSEDTGFFAFLAGGGRTTEIAQTEDEKEKSARPAGPAERGGDETGSPVSGAAVGEKDVTEADSGIGEARVIRPQFNKAQYDALLAAGADALKHADYSTAEKKYNDAAEFAAESRENERKLKAEQMAKRAKVFGALVSQIPLEPIADGKNIAEISLTFGGREPFVARIIEETKNHVKIEKESGISATFQKSDIDEIKRITPDQYRKRLIVKLDQQLREAEKSGKPSYIDLYQCAYLAARFKLSDRITGLLEKTFALDTATDLIEIFCPDKDPLSLKVALLESYGKVDEAKAILDAAGPAIAMADPYVEPAREPEVDVSERRPEEGEDTSSSERTAEAPLPDPWRPAPDDSGESDEPLRRPHEPSRPARPSGPSGSGALESNPEYQRAQAAYHEGLRYYRRSLPGMPDHVKNLRAAEPHMRTAMDILTRLSEQHPENSAIEEQIQQINTIIYDIIKRSPLER